jgi:hypothetical protein
MIIGSDIPVIFDFGFSILDFSIVVPANAGIELSIVVPTNAGIELSIVVPAPTWLRSYVISSEARDLTDAQPRHPLQCSWRKGSGIAEIPRLRLGMTGWVRRD